MWLAFFPSKAVGDEVSDRLGRRHQFEQQLKAFSGRFCQQKINASEIPAGSIEALDDRRLLRCGISTGLTSSQGLGRAKTYFSPKDCTQPVAVHVDTTLLSMFLPLRVCSQPWRNLGPR